MSSRAESWEDAPSERKRYWLLLEITEAVARSKSLSDAFNELAAPVLSLTGGDLLDFSLHDSNGNRMSTQYWKRNQ
jgi:hypothetical protein